MKRLLTAAVAVLATAGLAACGGNDKPDSAATTPAVTSAATSAAPTPEPTPSAAALSRGLILSTCEKQGSADNLLTAFDTTGASSTTGAPLGSATISSDLTFNQDYSIGGCNTNPAGRLAMTAYNYDAKDGNEPFSKFFASKKLPDGSAQVGYYNSAVPGFTPLTQTTPSGDGLDAVAKDWFPSYHDGRVYFVRFDSDDNAKLMSVSANGGDERAEHIPGLDFKHYSLDQDMLYMPETATPISAGVTDNAVFSADGRLAAVMQNDKVVIGPADTDLTGRINQTGTQIDTSKFSNQYDVAPVGFIPGADQSLYITDQVSLFRIDGGRVTTAYKNESGKRITDVTMSANGDLAFLLKTDATTTRAFVLAKGATKPTLVAEVTNVQVVNILRLS